MPGRGHARFSHSLGFTEVNNESQDFEINTFSGDNSFYHPSVDLITMGEGGVDDAEDAEVIWHEYGHAIQDDVVPGFGESDQAGAIGEGFGDYWAVSMSIPVSKNYDLPCVMVWDATSSTSARLLYGKAAADQVTRAFEARKIL